MKLGRIEVEMGDVDISGPKDILYTKGLVTCLGLTLYNPKTKLGLVAHCPGSYTLALDFLAEILDQSIDKRKLFSAGSRGYIVSPSMTWDRESLQEISEARKAIPNLINRLSGPVDFSFHPCREEYGVSLLGLVPKTGKQFQREYTDRMMLDRWGT